MSNKKKLIDSVSIGSDPELFLRSLETNKYVPAFKFIEGDKWNPTPITDKGHAIQHDNVMVEYNIPPCKTAEDFVKENNFVLDYLQRTICEPNKLEMVKFPFADFDEKDLIDERAVTFGCSSDYNAYNGGKIPNTVGKPSVTARCSGGHIHIGYDKPTTKVNLLIVRALDIFISIPLLLMEPDNRRKEMYGKAGAFRECSYGVELRSPSNWWVSSDEMMAWVFNQAMKAIDYLNSLTKIPKILKDKTIENIINNKLLEEAQQVIKEFDLELVNKELV